MFVGGSKSFSVGMKRTLMLLKKSQTGSTASTGRARQKVRLTELGFHRAREYFRQSFMFCSLTLKITRRADFSLQIGSAKLTAIQIRN